jgi:hypothetical protein
MPKKQAPKSVPASLSPTKANGPLPREVGGLIKRENECKKSLFLLFSWQIFATFLLRTTITLVHIALGALRVLISLSGVIWISHINLPSFYNVNVTLL